MDMRHVMRVRNELGLSLREAADAVKRYGSAEAALADLKQPGKTDAYIAQYDQQRDQIKRLTEQKAELLEALRGLLPQTFTGNPTQAELTAHWERERDMGNGMDPFVLAAYAAIAKAEGQS